MRIVSAEEMRAVEAQAAALGVPEPELMAHAGSAVARVVRQYVPEPRPILVLVGTGNNGGDAVVAARDLLAAHYPITLWIDPSRRAPLPVPEADLRAASIAHDTAALATALQDAAAIVDGLFGTGLRRPIEGVAGEVIDTVNAATTRPGGPLVVAIDVPSGVMADSGGIAGRAVHAGITAALGYPKRGLYLGAGADHAGRIEIVGIGLPEGIQVSNGPQTITDTLVRDLLPVRQPTADKRDVGSVMIVGGAINYPGAPRLAGLGAMRAGAGYVTLAIPRSIYGIAASSLLEATYLPLPEFDGELGERAAESLGEELERYTAMVIGCGLGREAGTERFIERLFGAAPARRARIGFGGGLTEEGEAKPLVRPDMPLVIDADALVLLSGLETWHERIHQPAVLTPNIREMARLTGETTEAIEADPWRITGEAAARWGHVVVLKKGHSVVAAPDGRLWVAAQALPALATAGSGDVLSGVIGGLLAQGLEPWQAAVVALYLGTLAAERGVQEFGVAGLVAGDLPVLIAKALHELAGALVAATNRTANA